MRIAAYCRVSTAKEEQLDSLAHQKEFFQAYAQRNGYELVKIYADEGISGTRLQKREQFQALLHDAKGHRFELVVVKDISRFARNTVDFLQSVRALKELGVNTRFLTADMDSLGESEFVLTVFGALAQEESANLSKRVKFGKKLNAQKGRVPRCIYGYDRIDNFTLQINQAEADVVRLIDAYVEKMRESGNTNITYEYILDDVYGKDLTNGTGNLVGQGDQTVTYDELIFSWRDHSESREYAVIDSAYCSYIIDTFTKCTGACAAAALRSASSRTMRWNCFSVRMTLFSNQLGRFFMPI